MVRPTQTIRWPQPKNCLSVFDHFLGLALKELTFYVDYIVDKSIFSFSKV